MPKEINHKSPKSPKSPKIYKKFYCEDCDYTTGKPSEWKKHLNTNKHKKTLNDTKDTEDTTDPPEIIHKCRCGKIYQYHSGLSRHKKKCSHPTLLDSKDAKYVKDVKDVNDTEGKNQDHSGENNDKLIDYLMKENKEMKNMMMEMCKQMQSLNTTNNNTNNTNNTTNNIFNINMFLNEQCKDAMNMSEFIESIQLNVEDITSIGEKGQVEGMANILVEKLNEIDIFKRPVHCSDVKRETIYVKDEDKWEKEAKEKPKLKGVIDELTKKSVASMPYLENDPKKYIKTASEVLKDPRNDKKIISKIAKNVRVNV